MKWVGEPEILERRGNGAAAKERQWVELESGELVEVTIDATALTGSHTSYRRPSRSMGDIAERFHSTTSPVTIAEARALAEEMLREMERK